MVLARIGLPCGWEFAVKSGRPVAQIAPFYSSFNAACERAATRGCTGAIPTHEQRFGLMSLSVQTDNTPDRAKGTVFPHTTQASAVVETKTDRTQPEPVLPRRRARRDGPLFYLSTLGSFVCAALAMPAAMTASGELPLPVLLTAFVIHLVALGLFTVAKRGEQGTMLAMLGFVGLVSWSVAQTGGLSSPLLVFFGLAPIEAILTQRRRYIHTALFITLTGLTAAVLYAAPAGGSQTMTQSQLVFMAFFGVLYAFSLAARIVRADSLKGVKAQAERRAIDQFHAVTHDMFVILRRDGSVQQVFGAVGSILGCQQSALRATGFFERLHIADRPSFLSALDRVHATGQRDTVEVRLRSGADDAPQTFIWAEIDMSVLSGQDGEKDIYALVRDISAFKQRATELTLAREKAEASDAAKGRFLATMSHELRTPLNAIIGFADILDEEVFGALANEQQREYVGLIRESGGHLLQLVNDLLDMSKLEAGHFHIVAEPFALKTVTDRCVRLMGQQMEKAELTFVNDVPEAMPELVADQRAVRQVVINLLSNASKFTPAGGTITLRARSDGPMLVISVIDTGIGIAAKDLGSIGQPFFQANNAYDRDHQGTGLGLSVVKGLCELHKGSLSITSVEGEGTTVTVRLPFKGPHGAKTMADADQHAANTVVLAKLQKERGTLDTAESAQADTELDPAAPAQDIFEEEGQRAHG